MQIIAMTEELDRLKGVLSGTEEDLAKKVKECSELV
jgi:hypothetical protein